jgi:FtsP/CotA-like multicopper oxidase with cupredoxin domain
MRGRTGGTGGWLSGLVALAGFWGVMRSPPPGVPAVVANDNRVAAGRMRGDTLAIRLVVERAMWRPEAASGPAIEVAAFAEEGRAPRIPGPLMRVRTGATIVATVRNALPDSTISIHGLLARPAATDDSIVLRPGESRTVRFAAGAPGTYLYAAMLGKRDFDNTDETDAASGAIVVDPAGGSPPDRILMINIWGRTLDSTTYRNALAINGKSWPWDERMQMTVGDTVRWRVINASVRNHPMHLHGFFFDVTARGNQLADTLYAAGDRRSVVTEGMRAYTTMDMAFVPDRPGNWLFHCHIGFHVVPDARLDPPGPADHDRMSDDPAVHMAGLVVGLTVRPRAGAAPPDRSAARRLRLYVDEGTRRGRARRALGFVLQQGDRPPAADSLERSSSLLVLTRGEPTDITVLNRLGESAAIHWHGVELESYSDGVPGWSGAGSAVAHMIPARDSFVAHLTLPRAGTFMYHTHLNDFEQLTSGLYGGIIVLEPGQRYDPARDHIFVAGWDGAENRPPHLLVNGDSAPPPLVLAADVPHRFRFVNIGVAVRFRIAIVRDSALQRWRPLAKDGADLPAARAVAGPARQVIEVGETFDAEFSSGPGEYRLVFSTPAGTLYERRLIFTHAPDPNDPRE